MQLFSGIKDTVNGYVNSKIRLFQLEIVERISEFFSNLMYMLVLVTFFLLGFFFALLFLVKLINHWSQNPYLGYGIISGLCVILLLILSRESVQISITNKIKKRIVLSQKTQEDGGENSDNI